LGIGGRSYLKIDSRKIRKPQQYYPPLIYFPADIVTIFPLLPIITPDNPISNK
jgi:hypothetical protein